MFIQRELSGNLLLELEGPSVLLASENKHWEGAGLVDDVGGDDISTPPRGTDYASARSSGAGMHLLQGKE